MVSTEFSDADIRAMEPMTKVGLLATVNPDSQPHLTLLASLRGSAPTQLTFGQFIEGLSKQYIRERPKVGFLVMTLNKEIWRGKAAFTRTARQGPEFEFYNNTPMFRYNSYFGVHTVFYMDLIGHSGRQVLPIGQVVVAAIKTMAARTLATRHGSRPVLNPWTQRLMNKLDNLKFLAWIGVDGYPVIIPAIQAQASDSEHILFSAAAFRQDLEAIPTGVSLALFGMSLQMEDVLVRGRFEGIRRFGGMRCGRVRVEWVYNPMPPTPQQIYPSQCLEPVTAF